MARLATAPIRPTDSQKEKTRRSKLALDSHRFSSLRKITVLIIDTIDVMATLKRAQIFLEVGLHLSLDPRSLSS
jgi:hypothetical protein